MSARLGGWCWRWQCLQGQRSDLSAAPAATLTPFPPPRPFTTPPRIRSTTLGWPGSAAWKLDDPALLAAEHAERQAAAAEAARRKVANALDKKVCLRACVGVCVCCLAAKRVFAGHCLHHTTRLARCLHHTASHHTSHSCQAKELEKLQKLAALPSEQEALKDK